MGCGASKVSPASPSAQQQHGKQLVEKAVEKPWAGAAKNQVVPYPNESSTPTEALKRTQSSSTQSSDTSKASGVFITTPETLAADVRGLCSQPVPGTDLQTLAEHLQPVLGNLAPFLRVHAHISKRPILVGIAADARRCMSAVLGPVVAHMERLLSSKQATSPLTGDPTSWDEMQFPDLLYVLEAACNYVFGLGVMEVGRPVAILLDLLTQLRQHCVQRGFPLLQYELQVAPICELLSMASIVFFRKVVLESVDSARARVEEYQQLRDQLGWNDEHLVVCLDARAKATLVYLAQVSSGGERRGNVTVQRSAALWDALASPLATGLLRAASTVSALPVSVKLFPSFLDEYADGSSGKRGPAVEAGEGHGPRKEFFLLAGHGLAGQRPKPRTSSCGPTTPDEFEPDTSQERPALFTYNRSAGYYWVNQSLQQSQALAAAYTFAGWLLGQCVLNRAPLGLRLPAILFKMLSEGAAFTPTLEQLEEYDPAAAQSIKQVANLPADQLRGLVEMEGLPRNTNAEAYTAHALRALLVHAVAWQMDALRQGFAATLDRRALSVWQMGAAELSQLVEGAAALDTSHTPGSSHGAGGAGGADASQQPYIFKRLFRVVLDDELSGRSAALGELLFSVLGCWPRAEQLRFVEFVTGTPRLPLPGSELLKVQAPFVAMGLTEHKCMLGMLPQAHTCDNLLELPNYWESILVTKGYARSGAMSAPTLTPQQDAEVRAECTRILEDRLRLAVGAFSGYGLDEREGDGSAMRDDPSDVDSDPFSPSHASLQSSPSVSSSVRLTATSLACLRKQSGNVTGPVYD